MFPDSITASLPYPVWLTAAGIAGLLWGSFAASFAYRWPRAQSVWRGRSRCPTCGRNLRAVMLIPLLSFLCLKGRCSYCHAAINYRYPLSEIVSAVSFVIIAALAGPGADALWLLALAALLLPLAMVDLEFQLLPDVLLLPAALLGLFHHLHLGFPQGSWQIAALGLLIGAGTGLGLRFAIRYWKKQEGLGLGDVKFFGLAGWWCGALALGDFMLISGLAGLAFATLWRAFGKGRLFPFGPALCIGLIGTLLLSQHGYVPLADYYRFD